MTTGLDATAAPVAASRTRGDARDALHRVFGYDSFRGDQAEIISHVIGGGDALVLMPTGGGKSLCYQIPALVREGTGVVISPLIALMQNQVDALTAVGVRAGFLNSTQDAEQRRNVESAFLAGELDLLYLAPEHGVLPANAGMIRHNFQNLAPRQSAPRQRGDNPLRINATKLGGMCSWSCMRAISGEMTTPVPSRTSAGIW